MDAHAAARKTNRCQADVLVGPHRDTQADTLPVQSFPSTNTAEHQSG